MTHTCPCPDHMTSLREALVKRNRNNRKRGADHERAIAKLYGGRRTGPLQGLDDVTIGDVFVVQAKKVASLWPKRIADTLAKVAVPARAADRIPLLILSDVPGQGGGKATRIVVWYLEDHVAMHGNDGLKEAG